MLWCFSNRPEATRHDGGVDIQLKDLESQVSRSRKFALVFFKTIDLVVVGIF